MASFRSTDISPDSSVRQGSRIVHPIYARYAVKDAKFPGNEFSKTVGNSSKTITPTNFPVNVRLCNRLRNIDQIHSTTSNPDASGYYEQNNSKDSLCDPTQSSSDQEDFNKDPCHVNLQPGPSRISNEPLATDKNDTITEKNKKSSIEQKRFYQRKLSGFSPVKFLPVGKLFKLLRPPLQRRNSCPVLSASESQSEAKLNETLAKRNPSTDTKLSKTDRVINERKRSCTLTKWTSHQELLRQEKIHLNTNGNLQKDFKTTKHSSFKTIASRVSGPGPDFESLKQRLQVEGQNSLDELGVKNEKNIKTCPESPVIEKTVIIVSENSTILQSDSRNHNFENNIRVQSDNVNIVNGASVSMNNTLSTFTSEDERKLPASQVIHAIETSESQKPKGNNITIVSSDSSPNCNSHPIYVNNNGNTFHTKDHAQIYQGTLSVHTPVTDIKNKNCDISNEHLLNFPEVENSDNINVSRNTGSRVGIKSDSSVNTREKTEYIEIKPSKSNNILYTPDTVSKSFSTFKSDPKPISTITVQSSEIKVNENSLRSCSDKTSGDCIIPDPYINFTLLSPNNSQQNSIKLQNGGSRKIYLPNGVTNGYTDNSDITNETCDFADIVEYQSIFNKVTTETVEKDIKHCDNSSSSDTIALSNNEGLDHKSPQPQLISITCSQTNKINNTISNNSEKFHSNSDIKVSVVNGTNAQNDTLDFGECSLNSSTTELQSSDINECYNVKLDAPEEVIVAGFHDFCHTMLSLEESLEYQDTGTVKRRKVKSKETTSIETEKQNHCNDENSKIFNNDNKSNSSQMIKRENSINNEIQSTFKQNNTTSDEHSSDKLLEEIQNSKQLEKMNIKDPDVIDAITALDNSLREASENPILTQKELSDIQTRLVITKIETSETDGKRRANAVKEDKIQCDNLIEEVLLEDISKRVPNANKKTMAPPPPKRGNCIAVTISNSNAQYSPSLLTQNTPIHYLPEIKQANIPSIDQKGDNTVNSNFNGQTNESLKLSDYCLPGGDIKRVNVLPDAKDDSSSLPASSVSSEDTNPTLPLQVSVDNNVNSALQDVVACSRTSPCSVDSGTSSHNQGYFVVVAIDFGTTYSGYAFSFTRDPDNIHMMKKWDGGDPGVWNQKTPTTLLLSPEGTFHSFGFSARDYYHDLDVEEARGWLYFEKFKMALHYNEQLSLDTEIAAANGKRVPAVTVFAHALRYFKDHALQELSDQSATRILNEDVRWVVTVPAIWKQPAKQFMRAAAYKAGIASPDYPDQLLIALEPEAASIYCRRMKLHQLIPEETQYQRQTFQWQKDKDTESEIDSAISEKDISFSTNNIGQGNEGSFTVGTRYMVVDCGGGTVDITVHELLDKQGTLKELQKASGGPYGSMGVDMEFENFLCDIFGREFMQHFKNSRPTGYVDLMIAFEARKRNASPYKNNPLNISLPFSFIDSYVKYTGSTVEAAIKKSNHKNVKWSQGMLRLEPTAMEALFKKTIEKIRKHIEDIIKQEHLCIDYIFLVGGFAESLILQKEIKEAFSSKLKVVIPQGVSLAILKGAVLFGLDPTTVNIRRLRMTYGVGVLNHFIHGVHPREKLVTKNGKQWCADVFDKFVVNEQSVGVGDVVVRRYTPAKDGQSCSVIHIYCSEKDNVYFITDPGVKRCATLILDLSDSRYIQSREIQTRMMFGDTEIKVSALDVTTGKCVKAEIDFLNH